MKRRLVIIFAAVLILSLAGCKTSEHTPPIAATTLPIHEFASRLCDGTDITVVRLISENVSCLHDYSLQVSQMMAIEQAQTIIVSGAGLEEFMHDILPISDEIIDASTGITLICHDEDHDDKHSHTEDPHIWLSPNNAKTMAANICDGLCRNYPQYAEHFRQNLLELHTELDDLQTYGQTQLSTLSCRQLLTFHDGFAYFAEAFGLTIIHAIEEESGREASAAELIELCQLVTEHNLPAIFTEQNGSTSAASIISRETGAKVYALDMAMGGNSYFDAMYHNIDTLKEALE